jgi:hypothetical protein
MKPMMLKRYGLTFLASLALSACGAPELKPGAGEPVTSTQEQTLEVPAD